MSKTNLCKTSASVSTYGLGTFGRSQKPTGRAIMVIMPVRFSGRTKERTRVIKEKEETRMIKEREEKTRKGTTR